MNIVEFFEAWDGKFAEFGDASGNPEYLNQCMDLFNFYSRDVIGARRFYGNAVDMFTKYDTEKYERITYKGGMSPQLGDVVIWGKELGAPGHIAIAVAGDQSKFTSFDQNYPIGSVCHFQQHNYRGVLGWLRPKNLEQHMAYDLIQKRGEATVYFRIPPVLGGDSVLIPISSEEEAVRNYGKDWGKKVKLVDSFAGEGRPLLDFFDELKVEIDRLEDETFEVHATAASALTELSISKAHAQALKEQADQLDSALKASQKELELSKHTAEELQKKLEAFTQETEGSSGYSPLTKIIDFISKLFK